LGSNPKRQATQNATTPAALVSAEIMSDGDRTWEVIGVRIKIDKQHKLNLFCVYRPPNGNSATKICQFLSQHVDDCMIMGDLNLPNIDWQDKQIRKGGTMLEKDILESCVVNGLQQMIMLPTRKGALLDLILTNSPNMVLECEVLAPFCTSDHMRTRIELDIDIPTATAHTPKAQNWRRADWIGMEGALFSVDWSSQFAGCKSAQEMFD
jgi:hypothetical protein